MSQRPDCLHDCRGLLARLGTQLDTGSPVATALADSSRGATNLTPSQLERVWLPTDEECHRHDTVRSTEVPHDRLDADDLAVMVNVFAHSRYSNRGAFVYRLAIDRQSD